jgi:hypothetical protein
VVVTAEAAGCYKPDARPYRMALAQLRRRAMLILDEFDPLPGMRCRIDQLRASVGGGRWWPSKG